MTASPERLRIAVLYGGRSAEHDVSVMSATNVVAGLDPAKYDVVPVFVTREGQWRSASFADGTLTADETGPELALVPGGRGRLLAAGPDGTDELPPIGALFPVLHGPHGEDGSVQGLAAVARVPLVGCGIAGSATSIDKDLAKRLLRDAGIPVARSLVLRQGDTLLSFAELQTQLGLPVFVKPARQGSSVGVSKVADAAGYDAALAEGFRHDDKLLAEEFIDGREIEFAVLEDPQGALAVSRPGEIVPAESHGFYSYDAKYVDADGAALKIPAELAPDMEARLRDMAATAFRATGCDAMARVDFFVTADMRCLVNEINTIPGFTDISMYAKALAASGIAYAELLDRLIAHGLARAAR
ncbi:D-alanine--D-alanine ligase family protein [Oricola sp.]|uniref:D-alanine--D-alanine ligase family protein n=1 Tax=Oricola sp. TaxID=1979950 RepID=UPI0025EADA38|nr:D-alanine--D-alanine ligase family protein [Oricola sp.]MCI5076523.1 D-alanine--D-alanine ligase [Oricola sp.]